MQKMVEQITNEIKLMYLIDHPNIIKIYNHFEEEDYIYLVLEYASGGQLWKLLNKQQRFDEQTTKCIMRDIISAVEYLHSKNPPIIHRDIKPENLIFDGQKKVKLADFGWSNVFNDTKRKTYCGTLDYLAPEMIQGLGHDITLDYWSLGVLLFEFLSGKSPFQPRNLQENSTREEKQRALEQNILDLKLEFPNDFPILAKDLILKLLAKQPNQRLTIKQMKQHPWFQETLGGTQEFFQVDQQIKNPNYKPISKDQINPIQGEFTQENIAFAYNKMQRDSAINTQYSNQQQQQQNQGLDKNNSKQYQENSNQSVNSTMDQSNLSNQQENISNNNNIQEKNQSSVQNRSLIIQKLNSQISQLQLELNEDKVTIDIQNKKIETLQENLKQFQDAEYDHLGKKEERLLKVLENEKQNLKSENDKLWEQNKKKDEKIQQLEVQLQKEKDSQSMMQRYNEEKQQLEQKILKLKEENDQIENKRIQQLRNKDKEITKLEIRITEMEMKGINEKNSEIGGNMVKNLYNLIEELNQKFQNMAEELEKVEIDKNRMDEMEKEIIKLKFEKENNYAELKMKLQEEMEDEIDRIKDSEKEKIENFKLNYEEKLENLEKYKEKTRSQLLQNQINLDEFESMKTQLNLQDQAINDLRQEQENSIKVRQFLDKKSRQLEQELEDYKNKLEKYKKK
ncbi:Protein kinase-like domain [Pseudocohnilembus persalinus]|uniref:Protein kinase-like domain n=1 Tax=Pseudocohnilembus persalinus TaxID=266149 RepID=A0A0V0RA86_PSEPJ|nr:Protein kinase-like domain [Pseudocohnilembus persalinus]|eukprot:KRX11128.1 Protein kinase-like domain [Pseudocohnilembus persalinus]